PPHVKVPKGQHVIFRQTRRPTAQANIFPKYARPHERLASGPSAMSARDFDPPHLGGSSGKGLVNLGLLAHPWTLRLAFQAWRRGSRGTAAHTQTRRPMTVFNGLPSHVLLVHFLVVLVPLTALLEIACALWPVVRRGQIVWLTLILAIATLVLTPITTNAGE